MTLEELRARHPHHKVLQLPDPECPACAGNGELTHKRTGSKLACLCICLSGDGRAEVVRAFQRAVRSIKNELRETHVSGSR